MTVLLLSAHDAAAMLSVSPRTLWTVTVPRGDLPFIPIGKRGKRYTVADLEEWIARHREDVPMDP